MNLLFFFSNLVTVGKINNLEATETIISNILVGPKGREHRGNSPNIKGEERIVVYR